MDTDRMTTNGVTVADDVLTAQGEEHFEAAPVVAWEASPVFIVVTDDVDGALAALALAPGRISMTAEDGRELTDLSELGTVDTPSWVSPLEKTDRGIRLYADTEMNLTEPQGRQMVAILVELLEAAGIAAHIEAGERK